MMLEVVERSFAEKLRLGAFYTPPELTEVICRWAIRSSEDRILEPSFGGCGFLSSSRDRLRSLGAMRPGSRIFGCDIDQLAFKYLENTIGDIARNGRFLKKDFLKCKTTDFKINTFNSIVGNPPFLSRHRMPVKLREQVDKIVDPSGYLISGKSALWVYFIYHSLKFLEENGRMAWILPASYLHADYAADLRSQINSIFSEIYVIRLPYGMFSHEGVGESTIVLLLDGYKQKNKKRQLMTSVYNVEELSNFIEALQAKYSSNTRQVITKRKQDVYEIIKSRSDVKKLGDIFDISIGLVTGNNRFFVLSTEQIKSARLPKRYFRPVITHSSHISGLTLTSAELNKRGLNGDRVNLFRPTPNARINSAVDSYLRKYPAESRKSNATFAKREYWYIPPIPEFPDAFMTCISKSGVRITLNRSHCDCTNTLYRLFAKNSMLLVEQQLVALSLLSSFTALSAEKLGRRFKSGSLKVEPSTAKSLLVIYPNNYDRELIKDSFKQADAFLRAGKNDAARQVSDKALGQLISDKKLKKLLELASVEFTSLRDMRQSK